MKKLKNLILLIICLSFISCASNNLCLKEKDSDGVFELVIENTGKEPMFIPKFYLNLISDGVDNNQFEITDNNGEKAWFYGVFYCANIPKYDDAPDDYIVLKKGDEYSVEIKSLEKNYYFFNDYEYFYIRYDGFMGKSNKLTVKKKILPIAAQN